MIRRETRGVWFLSLVGFVGLGASLLASGEEPVPTGGKEPVPTGGKEPVPLDMPGPEYDERGALLRPEGFEHWMFVGTSLGITYTEGEVKDGPGDFHNVYMQRDAFDHYVRTGEFPEKTVFVMTNSKASKKAGPDLINKHGHFAGPASGLEVAVKDHSRFDEGWAYYIFSTSGPRKAARAFPQNICYDCHAEHGADDNVFAQFYAVLESARAKEKGGQESAGGAAEE